eukprot:Sspe_Gene.78535::Locus_49125_Transcript_1_1_Confidence_1.000_Length_1364::g.78535::m.78535
MQLDTPAAGKYTGTLRWKAGVAFPALPRFPKDRPILNSWKIYLSMRLTELGQKMGRVELQPQQLDALSFPLTLACVIKKLVADDPSFCPADSNGKREIHIVLAGAAVKTEQRILEETNYWEELGWLFPEYTWRLHFVGAEIREGLIDRKAPVSYCAGCTKGCDDVGAPLQRCSVCKRAYYCGKECQQKHWKAHKRECKRDSDEVPAPAFQLSHNLFASAYCGTLIDFLSKAEGCVPANTIITGFNTGMGSGNETLMKAWCPDMLYLVKKNFLCVMTCTNTWSDLRGELTLCEGVYHASIKLPPSANPFKAASVLQDETPDPETGIKKWYSANHCVYAFQGQKEGTVLMGEEEALRAISEVAPTIAAFAPVPEDTSGQQGDGGSG